MTDDQIKQLIVNIVDAHVGFFKREKFITEDDTPTVAFVIDPPDNSNGLFEIRYSGCSYDSTIVGISGISGIKRVSFIKEGGAVTLGTVENVVVNPGSGVMASSDFTLAANAGTIEGTATGATQQVGWEFISIINSAVAPPEILP